MSGILLAGWFSFASFGPVLYRKTHHSYTNCATWLSSRGSAERNWRRSQKRQSLAKFFQHRAPSGCFYFLNPNLTLVHHWNNIWSGLVIDGWGRQLCTATAGLQSVIVHLQSALTDGWLINEKNPLNKWVEKHNEYRCFQTGVLHDTIKQLISYKGMHV